MELLQALCREHDYYDDGMKAVFADMNQEMDSVTSAESLLKIVLKTAKGCLERIEESRRNRSIRPVRTLKEYIEANYMLSISTEDIARVAGVHVGHLHRIFPAETGMRIGEYLTHLRIEKAKSLLMHTDIPNSSIAMRIGISSQQYFCRMFKKETGMSPQEYRKSYALTCHYDPEFYPTPIPGSDLKTGGEEA